MKSAKKGGNIKKHFYAFAPSIDSIHEITIHDTVWLYPESCGVFNCINTQYFSSPPSCDTRPCNPPQSQQHQRTTYYRSRSRL